MNTRDKCGAIHTRGAVLGVSVAVALFTNLASGQTPPTTSGPADRTEISRLLANTGVVLVDMNQDCALSDVDIAMMVHDRLLQRFGSLITIPDLNGNGDSDQGDLLEAISQTLLLAFGEAAPTSATVDWDDIVVVAGGIQAGLPEADANLDQVVDGDDLMIVINNLGVRVDRFAIERSASSIFGYLDAFQQHGRESFVAVECAPSDHERGISNTWPERHPAWWKPNHQKAVSLSYDPFPPNHELSASERNTYPKTHIKAVSDRWPANHAKEASATWPPPSYPSDHAYWASSGHEVQRSISHPNEAGQPFPTHSLTDSGQFPAGHIWESSKSWPHEYQHDKVISRGWWPMHFSYESRGGVGPPRHATEISGTWVHQTSVSQGRWPPNHSNLVSDGWGLGHQMQYSGRYPPNHVVYASGTWPGPRPAWPPSHTATMSDSWPNHPTGPSDWPTWPPDHSWYTTAQDWVPSPRFPW